MVLATVIVRVKGGAQQNAVSGSGVMFLVVVNEGQWILLKFREGLRSCNA